MQYDDGSPWRVKENPVFFRELLVSSANGTSMNDTDNDVFLVKALLSLMATS